MRLLIGPNGWTKSPKWCCTGPREEGFTEGGEGASWFEGGLPPLSLPCSLFWSPHLCLLYPSPSPTLLRQQSYRLLLSPVIQTMPGQPHLQAQPPPKPHACVSFLRKCTPTKRTRWRLHLKRRVLGCLWNYLRRLNQSNKANWILHLLGCSLCRI